jgi:hypothetical protein
MKIAGSSIPDALVYGVAIYAGFILLKPLISASESASDVLSLPSDLIEGVQSGNIADTLKNFSQNFWNFMSLGIPKKLGLY